MSKTPLPRHLRRWGLRVVEKDGWRDRGRPYAFNPRAIIVHHTASGSQSGNFASESVVTYGRSDLPGPLCQFLLGRDGTVKIIAKGYANHAGTGGPRAGMPTNTANSYSYGIEAENNGIGEPWTRAQLNAYYRLCAALLVYMGRPQARYVIGHKEWTSRKIDPAGINMKHFRDQVRKALNAGPSVVTVSLEKLQPGKRNNDVLAVKRRLKRRGFYTADNMSNYFGSGLLNAYARYQKDLGYTGRDANGVPGRTSLRKLGFRVVD